MFDASVFPWAVLCTRRGNECPSDETRTTDERRCDRDPELPIDLAPVALPFAICTFRSPQRSPPNETDRIPLEGYGRTKRATDSPRLRQEMRLHRAGTFRSRLGLPGGRG